VATSSACLGDLPNLYRLLRVNPDYSEEYDCARTIRLLAGSGNLGVHTLIVFCREEHPRAAAGGPDRRTRASRGGHRSAAARDSTQGMITLVVHEEIVGRCTVVLPDRAPRERNLQPC
jgi:hypothetical protein